MQHRVLSLLVLSMLCFQNAGAADKTLENIHLTWKPTTTVKARPKTVNLVERVTVEEFVDVRKKPELLGENRQKPSEVLRVTTKDNVSAFVTEGVRKSLENAGFGTARTGGEISIGGELREYFVLEENLYKGNIEISVWIKDSKGQTRWNGVIKSSQERFGVSYKADNYFEVLSDLLVNVVNNLVVENPETQKALAKR